MISGKRWKGFAIRKNRPQVPEGNHSFKASESYLYGHGCHTLDQVISYWGRPDRQEEHLKLFYMPGQPGFGLDEPKHFGVLTYYDEDGVFHEEKVPSVQGDYGRVYDGIYDCIVNGKEPVIKPWETLLQMEMLESGIKGLN